MAITRATIYPLSPVINTSEAAGNPRPSRASGFLRSKRRIIIFPREKSSLARSSSQLSSSSAPPLTLPTRCQSSNEISPNRRSRARRLSSLIISASLLSIYAYTASESRRRRPSRGSSLAWVSDEPLSGGSHLKLKPQF